MEYLLENNLIENTPDGIAQFLFNGEGLNKTAIGSYLGERLELKDMCCLLENFLILGVFLGSI